MGDGVSPGCVYDALVSAAAAAEIHLTATRDRRATNTCGKLNIVLKT